MSGMHVFAEVHTGHGCFWVLCDEPLLTPRDWVVEVRARIERGDLLEVVESNINKKPKLGPEGMYETTPTLIVEPRTVHLISGELV